jgi:pimeloyl-[acyl-carrier protein] methyl ester esterase
MGLLWAPVYSAIFVMLLPGLIGTGILFKPLAKRPQTSGKVKVIWCPCDAPLTYEQPEAYVVQHIPAEQPVVVIAESFRGQL